MNNIKYSVIDENIGSANVTQRGNTLVFNYPCQSSLECTPYEVLLPAGIFRMNLWGAQGGNGHISDKPVLIEDSGGKAAFVSGKIKIPYEIKLYFYVGGKGEDLLSVDQNILSKGGFNGGGNGGIDPDETGGESSAGGGGASDIRLTLEDSIEGYKSRIIVASGGGGRLAYSDYIYIRSDSYGRVFNNTSFAGDAGALEGFAEGNLTFPGTQTSGCFGKGEDGVDFDHTITKFGGSIGGSGGGYYGGSHVDASTIGYIESIESGGAGGSSFVSGCKGCDAVARLPLDKVVHTHQSRHYSGLVFSNIRMRSGKDLIKDPFDNDEIGHHGNGAISITRLSSYPITCNGNRNRINHLSLMLVTFLSY